jgi:DNA-binding XRE family transcriptional regulator
MLLQLGQSLKQARIERRLTRLQAGLVSGVLWESVRAIEEGRSVRLLNLLYYCQALGQQVCIDGRPALSTQQAIASQLDLHRAGQELTTSKLATITGLSKPTVRAALTEGTCTTATLAALAEALAITITTKEVTAMTEHTQCYYCRSLVAKNNLELDHFPRPARHGGSEVVPACKGCRDMKDRFTLADWPVELLGPILADLEQCSRHTRIFLAKALALFADREHMQAARPPARTEAVPYGMRLGQHGHLVADETEQLVMDAVWLWTKAGLTMAEIEQRLEARGFCVETISQARRLHENPNQE